MGFILDTRAITAEKMGYTNKMALLEAIRRHHGVSRLALAQLVGLDPSTVSKIVTTLVDLGLVKELGARHTGTPGRRSIMLSVVPDAAVVLVVSIGTQRTKIALGRIDCSVEELGEIPTLGDPAAYFDSLTRALERAFANAETSKARALIVSVPGMLDCEHNIIFEAPLVGWHNVDVRQEIKKRLPSLDLPVHTWNDANLSLVAETFVNPSLFDMNNGLCVYLSHGIGGAIWSDGRIHLGAHNAAGEIGHTSIDRNGPICRCGRRGCLNAFASVEKVVGNYDREAAVPLRGDTYYEKVLDLFARMEAEDERALDVLGRAAAHVGEGVASLVNVFDPDFVVMTGVGSLFTSSLMERVTGEIRKRVLAPLTRDMLVLPASLPAEKAPLLGAALVGVESLLAEDLRDR